MARKCGAKKCDREHYARGVCKAHYTQVMRHGRLTPERERNGPRPCAAPRCERRGELKGYCRKHARQVRLHGKLTPHLEHAVGVYEHCTVRGCREEHRAKGLCVVHYNAARWARVREAKRKPGEVKSAIRAGGRAPRTVGAS